MAMPKKRLSFGKKIAFMAFTTIVFFGGIECGLAGLGFDTVADHSDPLVGFAGHVPLLESYVDQDGAARLRTEHNKLVWFNEVDFQQQKPENTQRIFCVGGSTTFGRPFANTTSFCGWLQELLPQVDDSTRWELVNAGGVSYASYRIIRVMEELAAFEPDLFIVYTGQNEFLERRTYANLFDQSSTQLAATALLSRTRIWSLLQRKLRSKSVAVPPEDILSTEVNERLNDTVGPADYDRDDAWRDKVLQHFKLNLQQMTQIARDAGAEIVFVVPASNEKDCSPFKSEMDESGARDALVSFQRGREMFDAGDFEQARLQFQAAIDEDICPLRAPSDFVTAIRQGAKANDATLVDFDSRLRQLCQAENGHAIFGDEYFLDHVHPTIDLHLKLATWIIESMQLTSAPLSEDIIANTRQRVLSKIDPLDQAVALRNLAKVLHWSGKFAEATPRARDALLLMPNDAESLLVLADCLWQTGRRDEAVERYEQLADTSPGYSRSYLPYGEVLLKLERYAAARDYLSLSTFVLPSGQRQGRSMYLLAIAHLRLNEFEEAVSWLEQTLEVFPNDPDTLFYLAQAKAGLNETEQAVELYQRVLADDPDDVETLNCIGMLLLQVSQVEKSVKYFEKAIRVAPDDEKSQSNLRIARQLLKST